MGRVILDNIKAKSREEAQKKARKRYPDARTIKVKTMRKCTPKKSGSYNLTIFYGD